MVSIWKGGGWRWLALLALPLVFSGCVCLSVHPLYTADDTVFDPALLGTWVLESDADRVHEAEGGWPAMFAFSDAGDGSYAMTHTTPEGAESDFQVYLVQVGDELFMDIYPDRGSEELNCTWLYTFQLLGMHQFLYVERIEPELVVSEMNYEWLAEQIQADPTVLQHEGIVIDDEEPFYILTGQPQELQQFYAAHVGTEDAYYDVAEDRTYVKVIEPGEFKE